MPQMTSYILKALQHNLTILYYSSIEVCLRRQGFDENSKSLLTSSQKQMTLAASIYNFRAILQVKHYSPGQVLLPVLHSTGPLGALLKSPSAFFHPFKRLLCLSKWHIKPKSPAHKNTLHIYLSVSLSKPAFPALYTNRWASWDSCSLHKQFLNSQDNNNRKWNLKSHP